MSALHCEDCVNNDCGNCGISDDCKKSLDYYDDDYYSESFENCGSWFVESDPDKPQ